jgi:hypothetical protein
MCFHNFRENKTRSGEEISFELAHEPVSRDPNIAMILISPEYRLLVAGLAGVVEPHGADFPRVGR